MKRSKFGFISIAALCIAWNIQHTDKVLCASMSPALGWTVTLWELIDDDWEASRTFFPREVDEFFDFIYGEK